MGCNRQRNKKILVLTLVLIAIIATLTPPLSMAADDTIHVTFDPSGSVSLDVSPPDLNFSTVSANGSEESALTFTLYNNGSIAMKTDCDTNTTTEEGDLTLDENGSPTEDTYSLQFTTAAALDGNNAYITSTSTMTLDNSLAGGASETFKITIHLGAISVDHGWQTTTVNFTGTAAS